MKIIILKKQKHCYPLYTLSEKAFKGTVVNPALPSLHRGNYAYSPLRLLMNKHEPCG